MSDVSYATGFRVQIAKFPNWLTISRIFLIIPVIAFGMAGLHWEAVITILVAGITDGLDGWSARRFGVETPLGRVGDPLADKIFTDFSLLAAALLLGDVLLLVVWGVIVFYDIDNTWQRRREISRAILNLPHDGPDLPATLVSKSKTALLFVLLGSLYAPESVVAALSNELVLHVGFQPSGIWTEVSLPDVLALTCLGAVLYSWGNNRSKTIRSCLR